MHQALFIDEIVRHIFSFSTDGVASNSRNSLSSAARCCKAWRDPALDGLWSQLFCAAPLIRLIPGVQEKDGTFTLLSGSTPDLSIFRSYARRVRIITHRHRRPMDPNLVALLRASFSSSNCDSWALPYLTRVSISVPSWDAFSICMGLSPTLHHLTLDLGFNRARTDAKGWSNDEVAADYLENIVSSYHSLEKVELRGLALFNSRIAASLVNLGASLRVLILTAGASLSTATFMGIVGFPRLEDLEVHAGHIASQDLAEAFKGEEGIFPVLRKLRVRAQAPLVELLLEKMTSRGLSSLHIEAVPQSQGQRPHNWAQTFALVPAKAASVLQELTIEHHIDLPIDNDPNSNAPTPSSSSTNPSADPNSPEVASLTLANLRPLAPLACLRRLVLDTTLPPCLSDGDVDILARWWPNVEHLELGGLVSDLDCGNQGKTSRTTLACLRSFARWCPRLETLVLNLDVATYPSDPCRGAKQKSLRNLALGSTSKPNPVGLARYLQRVFPALEVVDGVASYEDEFSAINALIHLSNGLNEP